MTNKILVADDDADSRATIRSLLGAEFQIIEAASGREAAALAGRERPRLILLDIRMPAMGGVDALGAILAEDPDAIVIILTGECDLGLAKRTLELGAAAYVTKPFDVDFLRNEARRLMCSRPEDKDRILHIQIELGP